MTNQVSFVVVGTPVGKGSKRAFRTGAEAIVVETNAAAQKPWVSAIREEAMKRFPKSIRGVVGMEITFVFRRPKGHWGTGRNAAHLRKSAPCHHAIKPDIDKLLRCALDALTNIAFHDDAQVAMVQVRKRYTVTLDEPSLATFTIGYHEEEPKEGEQDAAH